MPKNCKFPYRWDQRSVCREFMLPAISPRPTSLPPWPKIATLAPSPTSPPATPSSNPFMNKPRSRGIRLQKNLVIHRALHDPANPSRQKCQLSLAPGILRPASSRPGVFFPGNRTDSGQDFEGTCSLQNRRTKPTPRQFSPDFSGSLSSNSAGRVRARGRLVGGGKPGVNSEPKLWPCVAPRGHAFLTILFLPQRQRVFGSG